MLLISAVKVESWVAVAEFEVTITFEILVIDAEMLVIELLIPGIALLALLPASSAALALLMVT